MTITPTSFNGHTIQDATFKGRFLLADRTEGRSVAPVLVRPIGRDPRHIRDETVDLTIPVRIQLLSISAANMNTLRDWFEPGTEGTLLADFNGTTRARTVFVERIIPYDGAPNVFTAVLRAMDPLWRLSTVTTTTRQQTTSAATWSVTSGGDTYENKATITVQPVTIKTAANSWLYKWEVVLANRVKRPFANAAIELTGGGFDHAAEVTATRSQADGDDIRVLVDGVEVPRWLGEHANNDANSTLTTIWANLNLSPALIAALFATITNVSPANGADLEVVKGGTAGWPTSGALLLGDECITYTGLTENNANGRAAFTGITRGARNTTAAAHTALDAIYWIERRVQIMTGNTGVAAPDARADLKPLLDLTAATPAALSNTVRPWINFCDETYPNRSEQWSRRVRAGDDQGDKILAAGGSPAAAMSFEYQAGGAVSGKPNYNAWYRDFPSGTGASGGNVLGMTRALADTLGMWVYGLDSSGSEIVLAKYAGALASGAVNVAQPTNPVYRIEFWGFNQVVAAAVGPIYSLQAMGGGSTADGQQIRGGGQPLEIVGGTVELNFATAGHDIYLYTGADNGSGVPVVTVAFSSPYVTTAAGQQTGVFPTSLAAGYRPLGPSELMWLTIADVTGGTFCSYWYAGTEYYAGLKSRRAAGTAAAYEHMRFKLFGRPSPLAESFVRCDPFCFADDGDQATVDGLTVYLATAGVPYVSLKARQNACWLNAVLGNNTTGQTVTFKILCTLADVITIDMDARTVVNTTTGESVLYGAKFSDEDNWIQIAPGVNTFVLTETGLVRDDVVVNAYDRFV